MSDSSEKMSWEVKPVGGEKYGHEEELARRRAKRAMDEDSQREELAVSGADDWDSTSTAGPGLETATVEPVQAKLSVDDAQVVGSVGQINRQAVYVAGGVILVLVLGLIGAEIFGSPTSTDTEDALAEDVQRPVGESAVEEMWEKQRREKQRQESGQDGAQLTQVQRLKAAEEEQRALEAKTLGPAEQVSMAPTEVDPWVQARQQARQRSAQTHYQQSSSARGSSLIAIKPAQELARPSNNSANAQLAAFEAAQRGAGQGVAPAPPQSPNEVFFKQDSKGGAVNFQRLQESVGEYVVQAGTMLPLVLETGVNSDLPGMLKARFMGPVYDSVTGRHLLIPVGSVVLGKYNASQTHGQSRLQVAWNRLVLPNGKSLDLGNIAGIGLDGNSGYADQVDEHWDRVLGAVALSSVLSVAAGVAAGPRSQFEITPRQAALGGLAEDLNETGQEITRRQLNIQPTITIRPGMKVSAFVQQDLMLEPYQQ